MKDETKYVERLEAHQVKPTALRLLLLRTMMSHGVDAFSLQSLEDELDTVDKSTIYRTITLFLTHHLIHAIDDGTGSFKYAVCRPDCHCGEDDATIDHLHAHFNCEHCGRTVCLSTTQVPLVALPAGFQVHSINYVLKGLCPDCASHSTPHQSS